MIIKTSIADINTKIDTDCKKLIRTTDAFRYDFRCEPDITVKITDLELKTFCAKYTGYSQENAKFRLSAERFFECMSEFDGFALKGTSLKIGSNAYVVTAASEERDEYIEEITASGQAKVIDDAYALIRSERGRFFVYSTPWSRQKAQSSKTPLAGICILEEIGESETADRKAVLDGLVPAMPVPERADTFGAALSMLEKLSRAVKIMILPADDPESFNDILAGKQTGSRLRSHVTQTEPEDIIPENTENRAEMHENLPEVTENIPETAENDTSADVPGEPADVETVEENAAEEQTAEAEHASGDEPSPVGESSPEGEQGGEQAEESAEYEEKRDGE